MILLIGATGFLGEHVARLLRGRAVRALVRPTSARAILPRDMPVCVGALEDHASVRAALAGVDTVVFCASMGFGHAPGFVRLLQESAVQRAVFLSTTAIFTHLAPASRGIRVEAEEAVQQSGLGWTILRPTMIYGTVRDRNMARLLRFLRWSPVWPVVAGGRALQQPIYVHDLAAAVVRVLEVSATAQKAYNLAGQAPLSYADLVRSAARAVGRNVHLVNVPQSVALRAISLSRACRLQSIITPEQVQRLAEDKAFDYSAAVRDFDFRTRPFSEGVRLEAASLGY